VTDTLEREIRFNWNDKGRLSEIVDFSGRKIQYTYDDDYNLVIVTSPATAEYPQSNTTAYAYSSGFEDKNLNHNLLSVADQKNQTYITNHYNTDDRIATQDYGAGSFQISYVSNTDNTLITTVIDRAGNKRCIIATSWATPSGRMSIPRPSALSPPNGNIIVMANGPRSSCPRVIL